MALSPQLLAILVCPKCHGALVYHEGEGALDCGACKLRYPVRDDIPVMLIDEAKPLA
ncbi:MAG: Trm112 family protein [Gemmatimonadetes bacterium]|nr:Trm112 family protein [Gemmatimonadota bacterium]